MFMILWFLSNVFFSTKSLIYNFVEKWTKEGDLFLEFSFLYIHPFRGGLIWETTSSCPNSFSGSWRYFHGSGFRKDPGILVRWEAAIHIIILVFMPVVLTAPAFTSTSTATSTQVLPLAQPSWRWPTGFHVWNKTLYYRLQPMWWQLMRTL